MYNEYHKAVTLRDFIVGLARCGIMVKRYTMTNHGYYSDYPIWEFRLETIGM